MPLFAFGTIHQGHESFSVESRGKQCSFISLSALLTAQAIPMPMWNSAIIDNVVLQGDIIYTQALNNGDIPLLGFLSLNDLPTVVRWTANVKSNYFSIAIDKYDCIEQYEPVDEHNGPIEAESEIGLPIVVAPIEAQNEIDLPIVVEPIEAQNEIELPIVVEPNEAQNEIEPPIVVKPIEAQSQIDLLILVEPIEAQNNEINLPIVVEPIEAQNDNQITWFVYYGNDWQGLIRSEHEVGTPYFTLSSALINTFAHGNYAILILEGYMMALIHGLDSAFYLFDPHARNLNGMPDPNGNAVVMKYGTLSELEQYLYSLSNKLNNNIFEIAPIKFRQVYTHTNKQCGINLQNRLKTAREQMKQKCLQETQTMRHDRLVKAREYQKRKREQETPAQKKYRLEKNRESKRRKRSNKCEIEKYSRPRQTLTKEIPNQHDYLKQFDMVKNGGIEQQCWAKSNITKFYKSIQFSYLNA